MSSHVLLKTLFSTSKKDILFHPPVRKPEAIDNTHPRQDILLLGDIIFKNAIKKPENKAFSGFFIIQGMRESNSLQRFWRPTLIGLTPLDFIEVSGFMKFSIPLFYATFIPFQMPDFIGLTSSRTIR